MGVFSTSSLEWIFQYATIFAAIFGGLSLTLALISAFSGYEVSDRLQKESNEKISEANVRAEEAKSVAAEANKIAEGERLERVKIEEKLSPRRISIEQQKSLSKKLSSLANVDGVRQSVAVFPTSSSFESSRLADEIANTLKAAGWDVNRNAVTFGHSYSVSGIGLLTSSNSRGIAVANEFVKAFNDERLLSFIFSAKRIGCEEMNMPQDKMSANPWCSQISIFVGDHP